MTETSTPSTPVPVVTVRRGSGAKVHRAIVMDGRVIGTYCVGAANAGGRADTRFTRTPGQPVDCKSCAAATL